MWKNIKETLEQDGVECVDIHGKLLLVPTKWKVEQEKEYIERMW